MKPKTMKVGVGQAVKIFCFSMPQHRIQWSFNLGELPTSTQYSENGINYIEIGKVDLRHSGVYTCRYKHKYIIYQGNSVLNVHGNLLI